MEFALKTLIIFSLIKKAKKKKYIAASKRFKNKIIMFSFLCTQWISSFFFHLLNFPKKKAFHKTLYVCKSP